MTQIRQEEISQLFWQPGPDSPTKNLEHSPNLINQKKCIRHKWPILDIKRSNHLTFALLKKNIHGWLDSQDMIDWLKKN